MSNVLPVNRSPWSSVCAASVILLAALVSGGCNNKSMQPGDLSRIQPFSDQPRAGNVYLLRGFIGIWSYGIDGMGKEINESGVRANVYRCEQWREVTDAIIAKYKGQKVTEPLVVVAHSWGADHAIDMAHALEAAHISIDLLVTLDPVTPPQVPKSIKWCYNIYQTHGAWDKIPFFRGVPLTPEPDNKNLLENINIRTVRTDLLEPNTDHYNIEKNPKIHAEVIKQILKVCPPREEWARLHPSAAPPVVQSPSIGSVRASVRDAEPREHAAGVLHTDSSGGR